MKTRVGDTWEDPCVDAGEGWWSYTDSNSKGWLISDRSCRESTDYSYVGPTSPQRFIAQSKYYGDKDEEFASSKSAVIRFIEKDAEWYRNQMELDPSFGKEGPAKSAGSSEARLGRGTATETYSTVLDMFGDQPNPLDKPSTISAKSQGGPVTSPSSSTVQATSVIIRSIGAGALGVVLGGAIGGPIGAAVGGLYGAGLGAVSSLRRL